MPKKSAFMCFILFYLILIVILSAVYQGRHLKFTRWRFEYLSNIKYLTTSFVQNDLANKSLCLPGVLCFIP